ncbi:hypothetical protein LXL04_038374 [Taraxacum kok-saghyz]
MPVYYWRDLSYVEATRYENRQPLFGGCRTRKLASDMILYSIIWRVLSLALLNVTGGGFDCFPTVVDAYALIGDVSSLAKKIQSFFMQEVISETHIVLKTILPQDPEASENQNTRLTSSDLCIRIPEC